MCTTRPRHSGWSAQQPRVRLQTAHDVLRQLGAVHPDDAPGGPRRPPRAGRASRSATSCAVAAFEQRRPASTPRPCTPIRVVRPSRVRSAVGPPRSSVPRRPAPPRSSPRTPRPAPGQEAVPVRAEHALAALGGHVVGQQPEVVRRRPGRVGEVRRSAGRAAARAASAGSGQVVVLDQHRRARRRPPRPAPRRRRGCSARSASHSARNRRRRPGSSGVCEEQVVDEPQGGVRHAVVGAA